MRQGKDGTAQADQQVLAQAAARLAGEPGKERQQLDEAVHKYFSFPSVVPAPCGSGFTRECVGGFTRAFAGEPAPTG
ncbi:hypothetical protein PPUJ20066_02880 [Pseudomonas putida]|nr:hypothetical protein PPUJ20066_02880 [Pseudomonas putida]